MPRSAPVGQVFFLRVLRFSHTSDIRSARYKCNIRERAVIPICFRLICVARALGIYRLIRIGLLKAENDNYLIQKSPF